MTLRQERRKDSTRARLLDAAMAVFLEHGYHAAVLSEVTALADLGTGTLYLHYRDKQALYEAVVRRSLGALLKRWSARADAVPDPVEKVILMVRVAIEYFAENKRRAALFLFDGPAVDGWLVDDIVTGIAAVLGDSVTSPELVASLVIGAAAAAGRAFVRAPKGFDLRRLQPAIEQFIRAGIASARPPGRRAS